MRINLRHEQPFVKLSEIRQALLDRLPEEFRQDFHTITPPAELTAEQHGIAPDSLSLAAKRIQRAIEKQESVVIFGDYDCDGVTATAILWETLRHLGLTARPFLPHREKNGYGLSIKTLEEVFAQGKPDLLITVDNGIVAHESFAWLKDQDVFTLLTDHHQPTETLPPADIIVHSTKLCGATVSWMLAHALAPDFAERELDLAVLGTFSDQVPLFGANRSFAVTGLRALQETERPSLLALAQAAGLNLRQATPHTIHYGLAPRINAMGRLYHALDALRALVSQNPKRIAELAQQLQSVNEERQGVTVEAYKALTPLLAAQDNEPIFIAAGEFHEGIIGLLASKVVEATGKPAILLSTLGDVVKASCRSVEPLDITAFLRSLPEPNFLSLGGHALAAGFSLSPETYLSDIEHIRAAAQRQLETKIFQSSQEIIAPLAASLLVPEAAQEIALFGPFGSHHEEPRWLLRNVRVQKTTPLGKNGAHKRIFFVPEGADSPVCGVAFQTEKRFPEGVPDCGDFVVRLQESQYRPGTLDILIEGMATEVTAPLK